MSVLQLDTDFKRKKEGGFLSQSPRAGKKQHCFVLLEPLWHYSPEVRPVLDILIKLSGMIEFEHFGQHNGCAKLITAGKMCLVEQFLIVLHWWVITF